MTPDNCVEIKRILSRQCADKGIPVSGIFELTPRCNLRCKMCYVRLTPEQMKPIGTELTAAEWIELGRQCADAGLLFLLLTGGEPTLRTDFPLIYEELTKLGLSLSINTNGTLLTDEIKELWHRLPPAQVNITIYGVCPEDYEALCGDGSAFDRMVQNLQWLRSEGILVHLNTTMTPTNKNKWRELEDFAANHDTQLRMTSYCFPPTRRAEGDSCSDFQRLTPEETARVMALDILYREGTEGINARLRSQLPAVQRSCDLDVGDPIQCLAGRSQFWVNWHGKLTPCGMISTPRTNLRDTDFAKAWETLRTSCSQIRLCPDCINCEDKNVCMNCAAVTFSETGRFDGKPHYMCRLAACFKETLREISQTSDKSPE